MDKDKKATFKEVLTKADEENKRIFARLANADEARARKGYISGLNQMREALDTVRRFRREERIMPKWDDLPNAVGTIASGVFGDEARKDAGTLALVKSMLPRGIVLRACNNGETTSERIELELAPIIDRIKHRVKIAAQFGQTLSVFANDRIDESTKSDDLALLTALHADGDATQANQKRKRTKHIPYKQALAILERLNCPKSIKTLQRWAKGQNTPEDFTPEKMDSVEAFTAWATIYAHREQSKINTNNALRIDNPKSRKQQRFR